MGRRHVAGNSSHKRDLVGFPWAGFLIFFVCPAPALAQTPVDDAPSIREVDGVAVRFYAPEMGGPSHPRFIMQRMLAFEARIQARVEDTDARSYQDRHVRAAMDQQIAEEVLAALPLERPADDAELARVGVDLRTGLVQRIGGERVLRELSEAERISEVEVAAFFRRRARAAVYIERAVLPILYPSEEQLRDVFRTAAHPFKSQKFEEARIAFSHWYVDERLRAAETAFLQAARSRVKIAVIR